MSSIILSTGTSVQSEKVRQAEYYPRGSLRSDAYLNGLLIRHEKDFLFIRLTDGVAHVRGSAAAKQDTRLYGLAVALGLSFK